MLHKIMTKIGTAETSHNVGSAESYRAWTLRVAVAKFGYTPELDERNQPRLRNGGTRAAYISDGRWVCLCRCGNGCAAHPEWNMACCVECGTEYKLHVPEHWERAEKLLLERDHPKQRHWFPFKSVALKNGLEKAEHWTMLAVENDAYLIR